MGIDIHTLNFLRFAKTKGALGDTITIGRQGVHAPEAAIREILKKNLRI